MWNAELGFGFVQSNDGGLDVFLHSSALNSLRICGLTGGWVRSTRIVLINRPTSLKHHFLGSVF
jgi:cold shock CspA family protein